MERKKQILQKKEVRELTPNELAIIKYEREIAALQEKYDAANEAHDWSMRNFYAAQMYAKRGNLDILRSKTKVLTPR